MQVYQLSAQVLSQAIAAASVATSAATATPTLETALNSGGLNQFYGFIPTAPKNGFGLSNNGGSYKSISTHELSKLLQDSGKPTLLAFGYTGCEAYCTRSNPNYASVRDNVNIVVINTWPEEFSTPASNLASDPSMSDQSKAEFTDGHRPALRNVIGTSARAEYAPIALYAQHSPSNDLANLHTLSREEVRSQQETFYTNLNQRGFISSGDGGHSVKALLFTPSGELQEVINDTTNIELVKNGVNSIIQRLNNSPRPEKQSQSR